MVSFLGWLNVVLLVLILLPFVLNLLNRKIIKTKNENFKKALKFLRKLHKPMGIILAIIALVHGYLGLRAIRLHTGTLLYVCMFSTAVLGGAFFKFKKKQLFVWHKRFALLTVLLLLLHIFYPNALWYLFN